jgi:hypothetical protein
MHHDVLIRAGHTNGTVAFMWHVLESRHNVTAAVFKKTVLAANVCPVLELKKRAFVRSSSPSLACQEPLLASGMSLSAGSLWSRNGETNSQQLKACGIGWV